MKAVLVGLSVAAALGSACGGTAATGRTTGPSPSAVAVARADLAPTGHLRLGFPAAPPFLGQQSPGSPQWKGLAISLGDALAARLGVSLIPVRYTDPGEAYHALLAGQVDAVLGPVQAKPDGTGGTDPVMSIEHSYLVRSDSTLVSVSDVDRPGIKVGSIEGSPHTAFLASHLEHAQLNQFATDADAAAALAGGRIDAYANVRFALAGSMVDAPGSRILDGSFFNAGFGLVTLSSHTKGKAFLDSFVASELSNGQLQQLVQGLDKPGVLAGRPV